MIAGMDRKTVLVVDDEPENLMAYREILTDMGHRAITETDGGSALHCVDTTEKIDLVITDLNMPNMDGYEFIKTLRESALYKDLPVVILSSLSDQTSKDLGLKVGAHSYLVKPFSIEKVQYEVSKYLSWVDQE